MKISWLGHSAFRVETGNAVVLIDPFLKGNPTFEASGLTWDGVTAGVTHVVVTHGHGDHVGDTVEISTKTGAKVITNYDLCMWLAKQGVTAFDPMNTGGTTDQGDFKVTLVRADHSAALVEMDVGFPLGSSNGVVLTPKDGPVLLHMGDTDVFSDMGLINTLWAPQIGIVPIGDRFTMGARTAAYACKTYFNFKTVIPCHYGTFPIIAPNADAFVAEAKGQNVVVPKVGAAFTV
ncbi:MAG TPA: metal-dependent hydrolase [Hyphomicrobiaceae bacterium]|nr:metal-dependent hydrolase [Hyphomicrobiaceae bacterium]